MARVIVDKIFTRLLLVVPSSWKKFWKDQNFLTINSPFIKGAKILYLYEALKSLHFCHLKIKN